MGRLLHHVPQVAGKLHLAGAGDHIYLHLQQLASHRGPGQTVDHPHTLLQGLALGVVLGHAQILLQVLVGHPDGLRPVGHHLHSGLAADSGQPALQHPDPRLPGVGGDDLPQSAVRHLEL